MQASYVIRQARTSAGLTQSALASRLGVAQSVVARLERAGSNPTWDTVRRALAATGHGLELHGRRPASVDLDLDQIRLRLGLSPAERLKLFEESQRSLTRMRSSARRRDAG
jgi:transcriptional regulator with XRE-family HTH domain